MPTSDQARPPLLETRSVSKSYSGREVVSSVDFALGYGEVHGLIGSNGAGKSTFTNILAGAIAPDSGEIYCEGHKVTLGNPRDGLKLGIAAIHQELAVVPEMSVLANVFLGNPISRFGILNRRAMARRVRELSGLLGLSISVDTPVGKLSLAARQKVEILRAVQARRRVLIMDEPTAPLDAEDRRTLYDLIGQLAAAGTSIIFISHDLEEVLKICGRVSVMRDGGLVVTRPAHEWTADGLIAAMLGGSVAKVGGQARQSSNNPVVFRAQSVSVPDRVDGVSFDVRRGEVLGIAGLVGSGRSELLRAIFGAERRASGRIEIGGVSRTLPLSVREAIDFGIGMVPEDRKHQGLVLSRTTHFNIKLGNAVRSSRLGWVDRSATARRIRGAAKDVGLATDRLWSAVGHLSGGNQQKALLARWLAKAPPILLLDEPSRGVDVAARSEIYSVIAELAAKGVGIVLVSSDIDEVIQNSDRVLIMQAGRRVGMLDRKEADLQSVLKLKFSAEGRAG